MKKFFTPINIVFVLHLIVVGLIALGIVPREASFALLAVVLFFLIFSSLEDSLAYTVRTIPFFIALPLTESFDSFNMWRVISFVVFMKWFANQNWEKWKTSFDIPRYWKQHQFEFFAIIVLVISAVSILDAADPVAAGKRVIYFGNMILLYPVVKHVVGKEGGLERTMKNIAAGTLIVVAVGYMQFATAINWDFMRFVNFWALNVQEGFYGEAWSSIVYRANTWFAYLGGGGLRLRIFSTFPDSHSMPLYLLMGLVSFLTLVCAKIKKPWQLSGSITSARKLHFHRLSEIRFDRFILLFCIPLILFVVILSGTRGIWVSALFPLIATVGLLVWKKIEHKKVVVLGFLVLCMFLFLLPAASYLYTIPQFNPAGEEDEEAFLARLRSSLSTTEVSNNARIEIWLKTLVSLQKAPLLGVGIGNFPTVLDQDVGLAKAGSSAHNIYLHVAGEIGFVGGVIFTLALFLLLEHAFQVFTKSRDEQYRIFGFFALLFMVWVFGYSLTDAALFDERAFLIFVASAAMITAVYDTLVPQRQE